MSQIVEFPDKWDELTPEQAKDVFELHLEHVAGDISERDLKLVLVTKWMNLGFAFNYKKEFARKTKRSAEVEHLHAQLYRIMETMGWLYKIEEIEKRVKRKTKTVQLKTLAWEGTKNYFPAVKTMSYLFVAPDPFYSMSVAQYIAAFNAFRAYYESKNANDLDRFFATLYLPERADFSHIRSNPDWDGRRPEKYNPNLTEYYAEVIKDISPGIKYGALLWFMNYDKLLKTGTIEVEGKEISLSALFKGGDSNNESLGLTGMLLNIAEEGTFGTMDEVMNRPLMDIYIKMYNNYLTIKNMKKK